MSKITGQSVHRLAVFHSARREICSRFGGGTLQTRQISEKRYHLEIRGQLCAYASVRSGRDDITDPWGAVNGVHDPSQAKIHRALVNTVNAKKV